MAATEEGEWLNAAITDDTVVAHLLLRLHRVSPPPPPCKSAALPLEWTVRQRRSRPVSAKPGPRASPTTPLSWSGATSLSGGAGGGGGAVDCEESSGPSPPSKAPSTTRSKISGISEAAAISKRSRKKKTLTELKEEEILLIDERKQLKKELAVVHANLEKQRMANQNLKRMKLDLHPQQSNGGGKVGSSCQYQHEVLPCNPSNPVSLEKVASKVAPLLSSLEEHQDVSDQKCKFVLPDLNIPFEEDSSTEILCGVH